MSIAVGLAVLDELYAENGRLIASAAMVGQALMTDLVHMQQVWHLRPPSCYASFSLGLMPKTQRGDDTQGFQEVDIVLHCLPHVPPGETRILHADRDVL